MTRSSLSYPVVVTWDDIISSKIVSLQLLHFHWINGLLSHEMKVALMIFLMLFPVEYQDISSHSTDYAPMRFPVYKGP